MWKRTLPGQDMPTRTSGNKSNLSCRPHCSVEAGFKNMANTSFSHPSADLKAFLETLRNAAWHSHGECVVARAPGRLDIMGGIADYSGSLVLQRPTAEATFAAL